ncbi:hypothetical protein CTI12_AA240700 [Artemisia annua]|uniref:Zinc knuckle CX2CX4HX4C n=1 Tax=Artemisia annua TaxID=35608 RepID=A0A2U1NQR3_ARTAN|nr:hypothetical protein CTI12_AA240700 [Artemisia annua]
MSELNPHPPNPDPINPNSVPDSIPPPHGPNEFVRTKRSTRNSGNDNKLAMKSSGVGAKSSLSVKKNTKKGSGRNKSLSKEMEGMEVEADGTEDMEAKDDVFEGSDGENEAMLKVGGPGMTESGEGSSLGDNTHGKTHVVTMVGKSNENVVANDVINNEVPVNVSNNGNTKYKSDSYVVNDIPILVEENPVLNPKQGKGNTSLNENNAKNLNEAKNVNPWPSLRDTVDNVSGKNVAEVGKESMDTVMLEGNVQPKVSFASPFKGLTGLGITTSMCEKAYGRASFARVLIEVDASQELVEHVEVCYKSLGKSMNLKVEYTWKPPHCNNCKVFGHEDRTCSKREVPVKESNEADKISGENTWKMNDNNNKGEEWKEVKKYANNGASTNRNMGQQSNGYHINRGGFNNRGRGGSISSGRGGLNQRNGREGNNGRYVPVEGNGKKIDDGLVMEGNSRGNNNKGKEIAKSNEVMKNQAKQQNDINMKNSFNVLANEGVNDVEVGSDEWVQMRSKIDLACDLGMQIAEEEKSRWSMDLKKYYEDKCNAKVKGRMMEGIEKILDFGNVTQTMLFSLMMHLEMALVDADQKTGLIMDDGFGRSVWKVSWLCFWEVFGVCCTLFVLLMVLPSGFYISRFLRRQIPQNCYSGTSFVMFEFCNVISFWSSVVGLMHC